MPSYRQRMAAQRKRKDRQDSPKSEARKDKISLLRHNLNMYRRCLPLFEEGTKEWEICRDAVYDIIPELSMLEQEEANMKDGRD